MESTVIFSQIIFQPLTDSVISPADTKAARPDTLFLDGRFYVAYLQLSPVRTFRLLIMDKNLRSMGTTALFPGRNEPTDIRICRDGGKLMYYAFETTRFKKDAPNHLNIARYKFAGSFPTLVNLRTEVAAAMPVVILDGLPRPGDGLVDDPAPFVYRGCYYTITRK